MVKKGYKQTEIGVIPEDWEVKEIYESMAHIIDYRGVTPKKLGLDWGNGEIRALSANNVQMGYIDFNKECYFGSQILYKRWMRNGDCKQGDLVFTMEAPLGNIAIITDNDKYILSQRTILLRPNDYIYNKYLFYFLISSVFQNILKDNSSGSTAKGIQRNRLEHLFIAYPKNKKEQTTIATVLSDTDALIEHLDNLIAKKKAIKQGTMQQLLTGKKRLPGFSGAWEKKKLGDFLRYEQPTAYLVSDTKYDDSYQTPVLTAGKSFILGFTNEEHGIFNMLPTIIFDDFTTALKFVNFKFKAKSSAMKMLLPLNEHVNLRFIYEIMLRIKYQLGDHKRHWISEFQYLDIDVPPTTKEQTAIATILSDMETEIEHLEKKKEKYTMIKQGMMQQLLTGKIRLI